MCAPSFSTRSFSNAKSAPPRGSLARLLTRSSSDDRPPSVSVISIATISSSISAYSCESTRTVGGARYTSRSLSGASWTIAHMIDRSVGAQARLSALETSEQLVERFLGFRTRHHGRLAWRALPRRRFVRLYSANHFVKD